MPQLPRPSHLGTVALPMPLPCPRVPGVAPTVSQPGQMLCSRSGGKDAVVMLIWLGFFMGCVEMIWARATGVKEGITEDT